MVVFSFACIYCCAFVVVKSVGESLTPSQGCAACARILHIESCEHAGAVTCCAVKRSSAFAADSVQVSEDTVAVCLSVVADGLDVEHVAVKEFRPSKFGVASDVIRVCSRLELLGGVLDRLQCQGSGVRCERVWRGGELVKSCLMVSK